MALADGVIKDKERSIILRKAESLGLDQDEIEMILDGKIALLSKQSAILEKYEKLHKPKLTYVSWSAGDKFVYDNKDYALIGIFWYRIERTVLTFVEDDKLEEELIAAYSEWCDR